MIKGSYRYKKLLLSALLSGLVSLCVSSYTYATENLAQINRTLPQNNHIILIANNEPTNEKQEVTTGAQNFVQSMAERGIEFLSDPTLTNAQKREHFENLLEDSFDIPTIGKYVLGQHWRTANEKQRQEYQKLFRQAILDLYTNRFSEYSGQSVVVASSRPHGKRDIMVKSHIISKNDNAPKIEVEWRVRYKNGEYKIIDIYVEQVSMAITQRSDFSSVIQRGGGKLDVLLAHLEKE